MQSQLGDRRIAEEQNTSIKRNFLFFLSFFLFNWHIENSHLLPILPKKASTSRVEWVQLLRKPPPRACKIHFLVWKPQQRFLPSRKCSNAPLLFFHPFSPWRKATSQPHINSSIPAISILREAPFLLKQRLIAPHSFARLQERSSTILGWGFHLFNAIFASLGKSQS